MDFKDIISSSFIERLSRALSAQERLSPEGIESFERAALEGLEALELKARVEQVSQALDLALSCVASFEDRLEIVLALPEEASLGGDTASFFELWPLTAWVGTHGITHPQRALDGLQVLTRLFTAEFDIRPLLAHHRDLTLERLLVWRDSENHHDRRLVSEGTRAYLPWGKQVEWLRDEPEVVMALITPLRDDPSEYVRRSVANNINDMTRRHGDWVVEQLEDWVIDASAQRMGVVRHALRSLVKKGHTDALSLLGYDSDVQVEVDAFTCSEQVIFGGDPLTLHLTLESGSDEPQALVVDFVIHHVKANGSRTPKVFKWKTFTLAPSQRVTLTKSHAIRPITTRRYFSGTHKCDVLVNGECVAEQEFDLVMDKNA